MKKLIVFITLMLMCICLLCSCGNGNEDEEADNAVETEIGTEAVSAIEPVIVIEPEKAEPDLAEPESADESIQEVTEAIEPAGQLYAIDKVNIRSDASTDSEVVGKLSIGDQIGYIEPVDDEWIKVLYDGKACFVASRYLTDDPDWQSHLKSKSGYANEEAVHLDPSWKYADYSEINSGNAVMYLAPSDRKNIVIGVNAGHGTKGGSSVKTWCHPDKTEKVTGGTTAAGATKAIAVSSGMTFSDGTPESKVTLREALKLKDILLSRGYDVLMIREDEDVQLDNVARTVICNNAADCHIAIHWDGDGLDYDKGCFYMSVPDGIKYLDSVAGTWQSSEKLGDCLIGGLDGNGCKIMGSGNMDMDLTQTSYSTVPSIDIELGNQSSDHSDDKLNALAVGLADGIDAFFSAGQ